MDDNNPKREDNQNKTTQHPETTQSSNSSPVMPAPLPHAPDPSDPGDDNPNPKPGTPLKSFNEKALAGETPTAQKRERIVSGQEPGPDKRVAPKSEFIAVAGPGVNVKQMAEETKVNEAELQKRISEIKEEKIKNTVTLQKVGVVQEDPKTTIYDDPHDDPILQDLEKKTLEKSRLEYDSLGIEERGRRWDESHREYYVDLVKKRRPIVSKENAELNAKIQYGERRRIEVPNTTQDIVHYQNLYKELSEFKKQYPDKAIAYAEKYPGLSENVIAPGQTFSTRVAELKVNRKDLENFKGLYGQYNGARNLSPTYKTDKVTTVFFDDPNGRSSAFELEFAKRYGGRAGLVDFTGYVPGGYQVKTEGRSLKELTQGRKDFKGILTQQQGQELVNTLAEYHKTTSSIHGLDLDEIIITPEGKVKLLIPDSLQAKYNQNVNPSTEIDTTRTLLKDYFGVKTESVKTISQAQAKTGREAFKAHVDSLLTVDPNNKKGFLSYKEPADEIEINNSSSSFGKYLVRRPAPTDTSVPVYASPTSSAVAAIPAASPPPVPSGSGNKNFIASSVNRTAALGKRGIDKAASAAANKILPVVGGFVVKEAGQLIRDPVGFLTKWGKRAVAAMVIVAGYIGSVLIGWIAEILIGFVVFTVTVIIILFIINSGAYITPQGGFLANQGGPQPVPVNCAQRPPECPCIWPILPEGGESSLPISQGPLGTYSHSTNQLEAIDVSASTGHQIYATHDGIVFYWATAPDLYGPSMITVSSDCEGQNFFSLYAHISASFVRTGQRVTRGDVIAISGANYPGNDHLHYEFQFQSLKMAPPNILKAVPYGCSQNCNVTIP